MPSIFTPYVPHNSNADKSGSNDDQGSESSDRNAKQINDGSSPDVRDERNADSSGQRAFFEELSFTFQEWRSRERSATELRNRKICYIIFAVVVFSTGLGVLIASLRKVDETSYGIQYNIHKKQLNDAAKSGGLFLGPPGYEVSLQI